MSTENDSESSEVWTFDTFTGSSVEALMVSTGLTRARCRSSVFCPSGLTVMRCQSDGPLSAGTAAQSSGCWNQLVPSSSQRSRISPRCSGSSLGFTPFTTTGFVVSGTTRSLSATW